MHQNQTALDRRLQEFRKKYYTDKIIRGSLILSLLISSMLFVVLLGEGFFGFSAGVRTSLVLGLGVIFLGVLGYMVIWPVTQLVNIARGITDFQIADMVRGAFPNINDKLINLLQLRGDSDTSNALVAAAIDRKTEDIVPVSLSSAINLNLNRRYLLFLLIPLALFLITWLANPQLLNTSSHHLLNYDKEFLPPAPFVIEVGKVPGQIVAGQDYPLEISVSGSELPAELFIFIKKENESGSQFIDYNLSKDSKTKFTYTLSDLKEDFTFYVGNPEVETDRFEIEVLKRPFIKNFKVDITYPAYTGLGSETLEDNVGDFKAIKGSKVTWTLEPQDVVAAARFMGEKLTADFIEQKEGAYTFSARLMENLEYFISLNSPENISNIDTVRYRANVLQDRFPSIYVFSPNSDFLIDLDPNMPLELEIADDFGFSKMALFYRFTKSGGTSEVSAEYRQYPLDISRSQLLQPQDYDIDLTSLGLREGDEIEYFIKVWDNDGVSGAKATTSATFRVIYPTLDAKYDEVGEEQDEVKENLEELQRKSEELKESYEKMQKKLLDQKNLSFDDKKEVQRMMEEHKKMLEELSETQEKFEETKDKLQENEMVSQQTLEKYDELNKYLEELNNPEIEEELQKLMEQMENLDTEEIKERMEKLQLNDKELQNSIERTLELIKQLEVNQKIDEIRNKLDNLKVKQDLLQEKLEQAKTREEMDKISDRQEDLNKQMEKIKKDLEDLQDLKDQTKTPDPESTEKLMEDADAAKEDMKSAMEEMEKAAEKMKAEKKNKQGEQQEESGDQNKSDAESGEDKEGEEQESGEEQEGEQESDEKEEGEEGEEDGGEEENEEQEEGGEQESSEQSKQQQSKQQKGSKGGKKGKMSQSQQNASESQEDASDKMQEMSDKLSSMQMSMQMQQDQENLENLRELLENLLTLSFDQEDLRDEVKDLKYGDPALRDRSQDQKKLQDDMGLVKDSLESLANRLFEIQKLVLDESKSISDNMNKSQVFFRNKQVPMVTFHQQSAMTSINNLANMLSDVMSQIQQQMMNAKPGQGMCTKPGSAMKPDMKGLSKQQQKLNQQMQEMMKGGKMDSDRLSEMSAQQEAIRKRLQELGQQIKKDGGKTLGDMEKVAGDMQQTETELINKQLTNETLFRQQQILSRMLQADKSVRERDLDDQRESKTGRVDERKSPEELTAEEYKNKIRQELLKSNKLEYSNDFIILIEQYYKKLEGANE